jgi:hypothetical protein
MHSCQTKRAIASKIEKYVYAFMSDKKGNSIEIEKYVYAFMSDKKGNSIENREIFECIHVS